MKKQAIFRILYPLLLMLFLLSATTIYAQENAGSTLKKNVYAELLGGGAGIVSINFDTRFNKGRNDGPGMRVGVGWGSVSNDYLLVEGTANTKLITIPLEVNYIFGKNKLAFELGGGVTYVFVSEDSRYEFLGETHQNANTDNVLLSYIPVGIRYQPESSGFMFKLNVGPLFNFSAPNLYAEEEVLFWGGLAVGYSFF